MNYKERLLEMYESAVEEAQTLWLSDYCASSEEAENRKQEDKAAIEEFKEILFEVIKNED